MGIFEINTILIRKNGYYRKRGRGNSKYKLNFLFDVQKCGAICGKVQELGMDKHTYLKSISY